MFAICLSVAFTIPKPFASQARKPGTGSSQANTCSSKGLSNTSMCEMILAQLQRLLLKHTSSHFLLLEDQGPKLSPIGAWEETAFPSDALHGWCQVWCLTRNQQWAPPTNSEIPVSPKRPNLRFRSRSVFFAQALLVDVARNVT